jgi:23S rRNA (adenine2503-C2)-methyltransferase
MPASALFDRPLELLVTELRAHGPETNVRRALRALYRGEVTRAGELDAFSDRLARAFDERGVVRVLPEVVRESASPDGARKLLQRLDDGKTVESVLIPEVRTARSRDHMREALAQPLGRRARGVRPERASGCVSTQVGCGVGCGFCASGLEGLGRNLTSGEIVSQALALRDRSRELGRHLATVVFMGMGEPLHNTDAVLGALSNLTSPWGGELGPSQITVSTIGVVSGIERLAREGPAVNLAVSLHAPDDETRARIIKLAPRLPTAREIVAAASDYARVTGRFVTISYVLLDGVNDDLERARELAALLRGTAIHHVNLIPWNEVPGLGYRPSSRERAYAFFARLREEGLPVHFRKARGTESDAACGQLRRTQRETDADQVA